jgi:hypothetical protein
VGLRTLVRLCEGLWLSLGNIRPVRVIPIDSFLDLRHKAVPPSRDRLYKARSVGSVAQSFFHEAIGPDAAHQLILLQDVALILQQEQKNLDGLRG